MGRLSLHRACGQSGRAQAQDHRPRGWPREFKRNALRTDYQCFEIRGPAQRERGCRLHRPPLAVGVQRLRRLAAHEFAPELSEWRIDAAARSRRDPSATDCRVSCRGEILAWHPAPGAMVASGRLWYAEPIRTEEVAFETNVFLVTKAKAEQLQTTANAPPPQTEPEPKAGAEPEPASKPSPDPEPPARHRQSKDNASAYRHRASRSLEPARDQDVAQTALRGRA